MVKEKILSEYLNTIYFGEGAYGMESAMRTYFGAAQLRVSKSQAGSSIEVVSAVPRGGLTAEEARPAGAHPGHVRPATTRPVPAPVGGAGTGLAVDPLGWLLLEGLRRRAGADQVAVAVGAVDAADRRPVLRRRVDPGAGRRPSCRS